MVLKRVRQDVQCRLLTLNLGKMLPCSEAAAANSAVPKVSAIPVSLHRVPAPGGEGLSLENSLTLLLLCCTGQGAREKIPCHGIENNRDQFVGFGLVTPVGRIEPLGFPDIVDGELAQTGIFGIVRNRIHRCQQMPGASASAVASHADHERL